MFIAPYDDPYTIAGQATVGMEILSQVCCRRLGVQGTAPCTACARLLASSFESDMSNRVITYR